MKVVSFNYTKANGDLSYREVVEVVKPTPNFSGYDVTDMDNELFAEFIDAYNGLLDKHKLEMQNLLNAFDLNHAFKQFKPEGMSDVEAEYYE